MMATQPSDPHPDSPPEERPEAHPDQLNPGADGDGDDDGRTDVERSGKSPMEDAGSPGGTLGTGGTMHDFDR